MKSQGNQKKKDLKKFFITAAMMLSVVLVLAGCGAGNGDSQDTENGKIEAGTTPSESAQEIKEGESLVIQTADITETAKFYPVKIDDTPMEILAVKASDGTIRTAFNTCEVCYDSGRGYYKQQGDVLVCQNCGNSFSTDQVAVQSRGCNPWPILEENKTVTDDTITLSYDFLSDSKTVFENWKSSY